MTAHFPLPLPPKRAWLPKHSRNLSITRDFTHPWLLIVYEGILKGFFVVFIRLSLIFHVCKLCFFNKWKFTFKSIYEKEFPTWIFFFTNLETHFSEYIFSKSSWVLIRVVLWVFSKRGDYVGQTRLTCRAVFDPRLPDTQFLYTRYLKEDFLKR